MHLPGPPSGRRPVLITGVAGLIGGRLARLLVAQGRPVVGCDNFLTSSVERVPRGIDFVEADCRDPEAMRELCRGIHGVVHCAAAAYEGLSVFSPHFVTDHVFGASSAVFSGAVASGVRRVVYLSSMARYGRGNVPFYETDPRAPVDPYGVAKVASEMLLENLAALHGIEYVIAVPQCVVGAGQRHDDAYRNVAAIMLNRALRGKPLVIYGDGRQRRGFTHVADVVEQLAVLLDLEEAQGCVVNVGIDLGFISITELATRVFRVLKMDGGECSPDAQAEELDHSPVRYEPARLGEVFDATCAHELVGRWWPASGRTLEDALGELAEDIRRRGPRGPRAELPLEIGEARVPAHWRRLDPVGPVAGSES